MLKRTVCSCLLVILLPCLLLSTVCAANLELAPFDELDFVPMEPADKKRVWDVVDLREIPLPEKADKKIVSFDINQKSEVVLALTRRQLLIYDSHAQPVKAFSFYNSGSYYVFWYKESVALFFVRSECAVLFTPEGELVDVMKLSTDSIKNNSFLNALYSKTEMTLGEDRYFVEKRDGILGFFEGYEYSRFVRQASSGEETVIYAMENPPLPMALFVVIGLFFGISVIVIGGVIVPLIVRRTIVKHL